MTACLEASAVWCGDELLTRADWLWALRDGEINELVRASERAGDDITRKSFVLPNVSLCLQQAASGGENDIVSSATLYNEVRRRRPDLLAELMQPYHDKRHNVDLGNERSFCKQPIFSFCQGHFAGSFLRVLIERAYRDTASIQGAMASGRRAAEQIIGLLHS